MAYRASHSVFNQMKSCSFCYECMKIGSYNNQFAVSFRQQDHVNLIKNGINAIKKVLSESKSLKKFKVANRMYTGFC